MASKKLDMYSIETELYKVINKILFNIKKTDAGAYQIKDFGIIYPLGRTFLKLTDRIKKELPTYDSMQHNVVIVENEKKWLLTRIKYGA